MLSSLEDILYVVCLVASLGCMSLLLRAYHRTGTRLLLWGGLCFVLLSLNNLLVVVDVVILPPEIDLIVYRVVTSFAAGTVLLCGFIWEAE